MAKEAVIQKKLMETLKKEFPSGYIRKIHQSIYSHSGVPDILLCIDGLFIGIEVKTDTGRISKLQERELSLISKAGGLALVCRGFTGIGDTINAIHIHRAKAICPSDENNTLLLSK